MHARRTAMYTHDIVLWYVTCIVMSDVLVHRFRFVRSGTTSTEPTKKHQVFRKSHGHRLKYVIYTAARIADSAKRYENSDENQMIIW